MVWPRTEVDGNRSRVLPMYELRSYRVVHSRRLSSSHSDVQEIRIQDGQGVGGNGVGGLSDQLWEKVMNARQVKFPNSLH